MSRVYNRNEKSDRNKSIYDEYCNGSQMIDISKKHNLSVPRIHRIIMQEDVKHLRKENDDLKNKLKEKEQ